MFNNLKKISILLYPKIKKTWLFFFLLVLLALFYPYQSQAGVFDSLIGVATAPIQAVVAIVLSIFLGFSHFLAWLSGTLLNFVASPGFISFSYTRPDNPVVKAGLEITQPLANIILVVVFIFVALAIALDLAGYGTKKTFAWLILIALLINFTPVICGLIIDAGNVVMFHFLKGLEKGVGEIVGGLTGDFGELLRGLGIAFSGLNVKLEYTSRCIAHIILNISLAIAFFLFVALFLMRYLALWVLVILSPIAFICLILPATKKFWTLWWNNFFQWTIIGIPCAFFLWLAVSTFGNLQQEFEGKLALEQYKFIEPLFAYGVLVVFLCLGFVIGLQTGAMGSSAIIRGFQAAHKRAQIRTLQAMGRTAIATAIAPVRGTAKTYKTYQQLRAGGATRLQALIGTPKVYWHKAKATVLHPKAQWPAIKAKWPAIKAKGKAAAEGFWGNVKDVAGLGIAPIREALGIPKIKKERALCPKCGNFVPAGAAFCPHCSQKMPTCSKCGARATPGAAFCHSCGTKI